MNTTIMYCTKTNHIRYVVIEYIEEASTDTDTIIKTGQLLYTNMSASTYNVEQNSIEQMIAHGSKDTDDSDRDNGNTNDNK